MRSGEDKAALRGRLSILHPPGRLGLGPNPFGKDVANLQLWQALARHGGYAELDVLSFQPSNPDAAALALLGGPMSTPGVRIATGIFPQIQSPTRSGTLLRGQPTLASIAWLRRRLANDRAFSLVGLIHTLAPPAMRAIIGETLTAPMHGWDALICTSPSVQANVGAMFDGLGESLAARTGGKPPPRPDLPVIPLGVDVAHLAEVADRPGARAQARAGLGLADDSVLVLWVGRLSYFEKAYPQPMFQALQRAAVATATRPTFVMAGWFPDAGDRALFDAAARAHAPDVDIRIADGNDPAQVDLLWAGADIFLSLVDNIQETFGITPIEAMAAGLPVVASDWDGYRATVRDGLDGMLIPTLMGPAGGGVGARIVEQQSLEALTYQAYVGMTAQHTAVHVGRAGDALAALIRDPELRRRMGRSGRERVRTAFDWPVVARQIHDLTDALAERRAQAPPSQGEGRGAGDPVRSDPFRAFAPFATHALTLDTRLRAAPGAAPAHVLALGRGGLDASFAALRATPEQCAEALAYLAARPHGAPVRDVLQAFPVETRRGLEMGLAWMAKYGLVDWLD